jgi:hypothetical protein
MDVRRQCRKREQNMNRMTLVKLLGCLLLVAVGSVVISAQKTITGTWEASTKYNKRMKEKRDDRNGSYEFEYLDKKRDIQITFKYEASDGDDHSQGTGFRYSDLNGLSESQVESVTRGVSFSITREAGTIECTGGFENGKGSGTFRFTPNESFRSSMSSRGFEFSDHKMFAATTVDVTVALADDLRASGFENLETSDLFKARIFSIDSAFMREMAATGFQELDMEDLVKARIFKINADFVRDVVSMGFETKSFEDLVKFRIFKITPEFLRDMRAAGFPSLTSEQAVKLRIFKVTPEFIREIEGEGIPNLDIEQAVKLRIFKVDGEFIREARAKGETDLSVEALVKLRIHGKIK